MWFRFLQKSEFRGTTFSELGSKTQITEKVMKNVPDSVLFPEYVATELLFTQKDDIKVASQQRRKSRHPGKSPKQRTQVPRGWQAVGGSVYVQSECHHEVRSRIRDITSYKSSQAERFRGRSSVRTLLCREALPVHPADHLVICSYAISSVS